MNKNVGADKDKFTISCYGIELPFEWYSMEYILKELRNSKLKNVVKMEKATKAKIKKYYRNLLGGLYRENPVKSRNYEAVKSSKKWENVGNSYIIPALLLYRYSYI